MKQTGRTGDGDLTIVRDMRQVLAELELTSNGVTSRLDGSGGGVLGSRPPVTGDWDPPHLRFRRMWEEARTDDERARVLAEARRELHDLTRPKPRPRGETEAERDARLLEHEGWSAKEVALAFRMTESQVRKVRLGHGRDPEWGQVEPLLPMPAGTREERRERARLLRDKYRLSSRRIAEILCVDHSTVVRDWRRIAESEAA